MNLAKLFSFFLTTEAGRRLGLIAASIAAILILSSSFSLLTQLWSDAHLLAANSSTAKTEEFGNSFDSLLTAIPQAHLFGYAPPASSYIPLTSLQIHLEGIIKNEVEEKSKAIIAINGARGKVYQNGELLPNGLRVNAIQADSVILLNAGHLEKLPLVRPLFMRKS